MYNALFRDPKLRVGGAVISRVMVAREPREIAARNFKADPVPFLETIGNTTKVDIVFID